MINVHDIGFLAPSSGVEMRLRFVRLGGRLGLLEMGLPFGLFLYKLILSLVDPLTGSRVFRIARCLPCSSQGFDIRL